LQDIIGSGEHLATVINDILDLSKIEAGKWKLEEKKFFLIKCVKEAVNMLDGLADKKDIKISYDYDAVNSSVNILGDVNSIKRVIINLLSNAYKYTGNGGKVKCSIVFSKKEELEIIIADTGIGIPQDRIVHVLNPFEQIHQSHDLQDEGTGLGLPIVKKLVELHGGSFLLKSEVDVGTSAIITIPRQRVFSYQ
jgi:two-component system, cell cycle sensor histidine kinase PleC